MALVFQPPNMYLRNRASLVGYVGVALRTDRREGVGEAGPRPAGGRRRRGQARRGPGVRDPQEHLYRLQAPGRRLYYDAADRTCTR